MGGPRSLFYVSKLAQSLFLTINIPPSILIGFNDQSRIMWNDDLTGRLTVKGGFI